MNGKIYINNIEYDLSTLTQEQIDSLIKYGTLTGTTASTAVIIDNDTLKGEGTAESPFKVAKTPGTLTFKGETGNTLYNGSADTTVDIGAFKDVFDKDTIKGEGTTDSPLHIEYDILDDVQVAVSHATKALTTIEDVETDINKAIDNSEEAYNYALEAYNVAQTEVSTHNLNGDDSVINSATSVSSITLVGLNQEITYTEKDKDGKEIEYKLVGEIFNDYQNNSAMGKYSHAEGYCTVASADCEHVQGRYNLEDNPSGYSFVIGNGSASTACSNAMTVDWSGNTYIQGNLSADTVYGNAMKDGSGRVITEFYQQKVSAGTNIGLDKDNYIISSYTNTYNINGDETDANYKSGITEVSEVGAYQVTEYFPTGNTASTTGLSYSAVGEVFNDYKQNSAFGAYSHAEGLGTIASGKAQHVQGKYNIASGDSAAVIIGNGLSASERSNAFIMDWSGNAIFYGSVSAQSISGEVDYASSAGTAEKDYKGNVIDTTYNKNITFYDLNGDNTSAYTASAITNVVLVGHSVKTEDKTDTAQTIVNVGEIFNDYSGNVATGQYSHAEGHATSAIGENSHAEGDETIASGNSSFAGGLKVQALGNYSFAFGNYNIVSASGAHAEGVNNKVYGKNSHAEGAANASSGMNDHVEGFNSYSSGFAAHAEGCSDARSQYSHSEGWRTSALTDGSHSEGKFTIASGASQHAMGRYNEVQGEDYVLVIGNGTRSKRSNAMTMDWSGNVLTTGNVSANTFIGNIEYATKAKEDANGNIITDTYQKKLTAGDNITISEDNVISSTGGGGGESIVVSYFTPEEINDLFN